MPDSTPFTIRPVTADETIPFRAVMARAFGGDVRESDDEWFREFMDLRRTLAAFDGDEIVGTFGAFPFEVTVPGGSLPMGGTTMVTVSPTHRRRGAMRAMMLAHLDDVRANEEPLAGLWASETSIYGRFGYGPAAEMCLAEMDASAIRFTDEPDAGHRLRMITADEAIGLLPPVYDSVRLERPGMLSRSTHWWTKRWLWDPEHRRGGMSARRIVVVDGPTGPAGYLTYRQKSWDAFGQEGVLEVGELVTVTPEAHTALWSFVTNVDLYQKVSYWNLPVDDPLPWRITDGRAVKRRIEDSLWLRILDVPVAIASRVYAVEGRVTLGIRDDVYPDAGGTFALEGGPDGAACRRVSEPPELELDVAALGAVYLGGHRFTTLAAAGLVRGEAEKLLQADRMFAVGRAPWCPEVF